MTERLVLLDDRIIGEADANVTVMSPTFQYGLNVFEGIRAYVSADGRSLNAFRLSDHLDRLLLSARIMRLGVPYTVAELRDRIVRIVEANGYAQDISLRLVAYVDESSNWAFDGDCKLLISPITTTRAEPVGVKVTFSSWQRIDDRSMSPRAKVGANYINSRMALLEARLGSFDAALFLNAAGKVSEGPGSCVFIVRDGQLLTPPSTASILESITRATVLELAGKELGLKVVIRDIDRTELYACEEAFFCGTSAEIQPISSVDGLALNSCDDGSVTKHIAKTYSIAVAGGLKGRDAWLDCLRELNA